MNDDLFAQIKNYSTDIHSLIKSGVKQDVDELIDKRNQLLEKWFSELNDFIDITNAQEAYLEELLQVEQELVAQIKEEQKSIIKEQNQANQASQYQNMFDEGE